MPMSIRGRNPSMPRVMITNMGIHVIHIERKLKSVGFLKLHDRDLCVLGEMIFEMVYKQKVRRKHV